MDPSFCLPGDCRNDVRPPLASSLETYILSSARPVGCYWNRDYRFVPLVLWSFAFLEVAETFRDFGISNPYAVGSHFAVCNDGTYHSEYISFEHNHALKAVSRSSLYSTRNLHAGEGFASIREIPLLLPIVLIILSVALFLFACFHLHELTMVTAISFTLGFYIVFFSYFDGGIISGAGGLAFMFWPLTTQIKDGIGRSEFMIFYLLGAVTVIAVVVFCILHLLFGFPDAFVENWGSLEFYLPGQLISRAALAGLFAAILCRRQNVLLCLLLVSLATLLYCFNYNFWAPSRNYTQKLRPGETVYVHVYTEGQVDIGKNLVRGKNMRVLAVENEHFQDRWDFCHDLLYRLEGLSYKSIMVSTYCWIIPPVEVSWDSHILYKILKSGDCRLECSEDLSKLFPVTPVTEEYGIIRNLAQNREVGVGFCQLPAATLSLNYRGSRSDWHTWIKAQNAEIDFPDPIPHADK